MKPTFHNATPAAIERRGVAFGTEVPSLLATVPADWIVIMPGSESP